MHCCSPTTMKSKMIMLSTAPWPFAKVGVGVQNAVRFAGAGSEDRTFDDKMGENADNPIDKNDPRYHLQYYRLLVLG